MGGLAHKTKNLQMRFVLGADSFPGSLLPSRWQRIVHQRRGLLLSESCAAHPHSLIRANQLIPLRYLSNQATVRRMESIWFSRFSNPCPSFA